jgi:hypothetical protein
MSGEKGIGVGGVVTQIAWLASQSGDPVPVADVVSGLQRRFSATAEMANYAIALAERCGAIEQREGKLILVSRQQMKRRITL